MACRFSHGRLRCPQRPAPDCAQHTTHSRFSVITAMPTTPLDSPPRPRFLADIALAAIVLLFLWLPSLALAFNAWDDAFLLLPIQQAFARPTAEQVLVTGRIVVGIAAAVGMPTALVWRASNPTSSTIMVGTLALAH